jgi:hypothetical protein
MELRDESKPKDTNADKMAAWVVESPTNRNADGTIRQHTVLEARSGDYLCPAPSQQRLSVVDDRW